MNNRGNKMITLKGLGQAAEALIYIALLVYSILMSVWVAIGTWNWLF